MTQRESERAPRNAPAPIEAPSRTAIEVARDAAAAALPPLALHLATLHPGLPGGDSGELIAVAATAGSAHPPGYPLWAMLASAWVRLVPVGAVAWRTNLLSALCMAAAAAVLGAATHRLTRSRVAGVLAAWAFAIAVPVWTNAIVTEVFALHALLAACVLLALAALAPNGDARGRAPRALAALAFLTVLALSHHHTLLLLALPATLVALPLAWTAAGPRRGAWLGRVAALKLLALAPLAWLPFAARHADALHWGEASSWRGFAALLLRAEYGTFRLDPAGGGFAAGGAAHLVRFARSLPGAFGLAPLALALLGAVLLARRAPRVAAALGGFALLQALFDTRIGFPVDDPLYVGVVERFDVLPIVVLSLLAGVGVAWWVERAGARRAIVVAALALLVAWPAWPRFRALDQHDDAFAETLARGMLASTPPYGVLFVRGDLPHNSLVWATRVAGLRPDVSVVDEELLADPWYVRALRARDPGLLPPLGRAERIWLRGGDPAGLEGFAIARSDGTVDVIGETSQGSVPVGDMLDLRPAAPESLFRASRALFRTGWPMEAGEDRYSGLPGTRNLLWLDHLLPTRPVVFVGLADASWALRDTLTPIAFVLRATPRGAAPGVAEQLDATLAVLDSVSLAPYFAATAPTSFAAAERHRFAAVAARAALLVCQGGADAIARAHPVGHARLLAFARRFEALDPTPDPRTLRAIGFLRAFDPAFRDTLAARADLERFVASGDSTAAGDASVRAMLARLGSAR